MTDELVPLMSGRDMGLETVIRHGMVASEEGVRPLDIGILDGKVAVLAEPAAELGGRTVVDATDRYIVPGSIDTHTHIAWPFDGATSTDDFESATHAAAWGGTTTVLDFVPIPNGMSPLAAAERRLRMADGCAVVDYGFHPVLSSAGRVVLDEIGSLIREGFASFKIYTTYGERLDDGEVWAVMNEIARHGGLAGFHAENHELLQRSIRALVDRGRTTMHDFPLSRPSIAEAEAIEMIAFYARRLDAPVWIYHLSGADALSTLAEARARGSRIQAETCTHYLTFDDSVFGEPDAWRFGITPPIRDAASQQALWEGIHTRSLSAVGSDHCAYSSDQKAVGRDDFTKLPFGAPGIDARLPLLWSRGVADGRISIGDFVRISATQPARALGMYPRKGALLPGSDADLVVIDPSIEWSFPVPTPGNGSDYSLYSGIPLKGKPTLTMVRGRVVAKDGLVVGQPGHGMFVKRSISDSDW